MPCSRLSAAVPLHVHASAATSSSSTLSPAVSSAVELLKQTSADSRVPPQAVFAALRTLEAAKLQVRECVSACACGVQLAALAAQ